MTDFLKSSKNNHDDKFQEDIQSKDWLGVVVDNNDPEFMGRCKVRVFEKFDELTDDLLPWAFPNNSYIFAGGETKGAGSFSYPKKDSLVRVRFNNGDIMHPEYYSVQNLNEKMQSEFKESYENCHVLLYDEDEDVRILYTKNKGLIVFHGESHLTINKEHHITIEHAGSPSIMTFIDGTVTIKTNTKIYENSPTIHLDSPKTNLGPNAFKKATRCEPLIQLLSNIGKIVDAKVPTSPGSCESLINLYETQICSNTVNVAS